MHRREFLRLAGIALAGLWTPAQRAATKPARRFVSINGRPAKVIDIHAHCVVPAIGSLLKNTSFTEVEFRDWQALSPKRIDEMDRRGIDMQVLSINRYWWYRAGRELAGKIVQAHDEHLANWCQSHAERFTFLSSVALQYPDLAAKQLEHAVKNLGARGASIAGHMLGEPLSGKKFDPFWAMAEELDLPVFMHPAGAANVARPGSLAGNGDLKNIIGNPLETTLFLTQLIFDGTLDRFPRLKICAPHAGGYLPSYLGRSEVACEVRRHANCKNTRKPSEYFRDQIFIDSMIFSDQGLRHLVAEVTSEQLVYGSDIPFNWPDTIDIIVDADFLSPQQKLAILGGNLTRLLKLDS